MISNIIIGKSLLETITSALYEDPIVLFREYTQNSVDAYKKAIREEEQAEIENFHVSIDIDSSKKTITIKDNGYGINTEGTFSQKMTDIAMSDKTDRSQYIGFRGIGRLSAMPFCQSLQFLNKAKGSNSINCCKWDGSKYRDLLNSDAKDYETFNSIVKSIVSVTKLPADVGIDEHYFKVVIEGYGLEIKEVIESKKFKQRLRKMLPLKYSTDFPSSKKIIEKYNDYMSEDFNDFTCSVKLNGEELQKNYTDSKHVLESDIIFWEIRGKVGPKKEPAEKIGILWFTFNKKFMSNSDNDDYGILVRSKNVLMGDNSTFADLCENSREHISTHRELTQALRGIYGELLINCDSLKDNARREWFKTDEKSYYLKCIIIAFVKSLQTYRYKSSTYFNNKGPENKKKLKEALVNLIDVEANEIDVNTFFETETSDIDDENKNIEDFVYACDDIPRQSKTKKKSYEELMAIIREFFEKENKYELFLKLRAFIKRHFNE